MKNRSHQEDSFESLDLAVADYALLNAMGADYDRDVDKSLRELVRDHEKVVRVFHAVTASSVPAQIQRQLDEARAAATNTGDTKLLEFVESLASAHRNGSTASTLSDTAQVEDLLRST
jgi:hypothetical protein